MEKNAVRMSDIIEEEPVLSRLSLRLEDGQFGCPMILILFPPKPLLNTIRTGNGLCKNKMLRTHQKQLFKAPYHFLL